ncbi:hypothetical protein ACX0MV_05590 [Pseudomonas borbori]
MTKQQNSDAPARDQTGEPVDVVRKDIERPNPATEQVDKAITPTSVKTKEQEAQKINQKAAEAERKLQR